MEHIMKRLHYRIGFPGWKVAARLGLVLRLDVMVAKDPEANVYLATSKDLDGLIVEAPTMEQLHEEVLGAADALVSFHVNGASSKDDDLDIRYGMRHSLA
jgi:hypothetical protein